jgi:arylformamidase
VRTVGVALLVLASVSCGDDSAGEGRGAKTSSSCRTEPATSTDIEYAAGVVASRGSTTLDIYTPARAEGDCGAPVVVWVHGGGWVTGDKSRNVQDKIPLFNDAGYLFVSVNYRLTDPASPDPVVYPTHNEDVASAIRWLVEHAAEYGGDPQRIAVLGHSAGASIVASVATDEAYLRAHDLDLDALACIAPLDTAGFRIADYSEVYRAAFPDPETWLEASPLNHVQTGKGIPPMLLVERGTAARRATLAEFVGALETAGVPVTVIDGSGLTHGDVNDDIGEPGDTVMTPPLMRFLADCFAG